MHDFCGRKLKCKNMKRKLLLGVALALIFNISFSQEGISTMERFFDMMRRDINFSKSSMRYKDIDGTPYIYESFQDGLVYMKSGAVLSGEFNYNIYTDEAEFIKSDVAYVLAFPDSVLRIELDEYILVYLSYNTGSEIKKGYFNLLESGEFNLLQQKTKILYQAEEAKPYTDPKPARFGDGKDVLFFKTGAAPAEKILKEDDFLKACGDRAPEAKAYIAKEKLSLKKQPDIIELFKYLNQK